MKAPLIFWMLAAPALQAVDFVRQIQLIEGETIVYDMPVTGKNGQLRSKPIEGTGAIFQLYAYKDSAYSPFTILDATVGNIAHANVSLGSNLLDVSLLGLHLNINLGSDPTGSSLPDLIAEKLVGTFIPEANITLTSQDPYRPARTRADQPYNANIRITRLPVPGQELPPGVPEKVTLEKNYKLYHPTLHIPSENGSGQGSYDQAYEFTLNGSYTMPNLYQNLPGNSPTKAIGEESFEAYVRVGSGNARAKVGSATIQIWPVCSAVIEGIDTSRIHHEPPRDARVVLTDLYPDSVTYAQIYTGPPSLGTDGFKIPSSVFSINTFAPQNTVVPLTDLIDGISADGVYTVEVLTITPFNDRRPERIAYLSFNLKRSINIRASMSTME